MPSPTCSDERLTYEDLLRIPEDGMRHEIIDGVHYVTASPNLRHQQLLGRLFYAVETALRAQPVGHVLLSPFDVVFTKWDVVEPDLLFVSSAQRHILTKVNVQGAPDLVVEIFSPSTRKPGQADQATTVRASRRPSSTGWSIPIAALSTCADGMTMAS